MASNIVEFITITGTVASILGLFWQVKKANALNEGQFILNLNNSFASNSEIKEIYLRLEAAQKNGKKLNVSETDSAKIAEYLSFFGTVANLYQRNILSLETLDLNFSYRFFIVMNTLGAQEYILKEGEFYRPLFRLYETWRTYKYKNKREEPFQEYSIYKYRSQYLKFL